MNSTDQPFNSKVIITIQVSSMQAFTGWDIYVQTNSSVIDPKSADITGNTLAKNYSATPSLLLECVDGNVVKGTACGQDNGAGIVEVAAAYLGTNPVSDGVTGLLFTITLNVTYNVPNSAGFTSVKILSTSTFENGSTSGVPYTIQNGDYGSQKSPDFTISATPSSLIIAAGSNSTTDVTVTSTLGFVGTIDFNASVNLLGSSTSAITIKFSKQSASLKAYGSNSTELTLSTTNSTGINSYNVVVNGIGPNSLIRPTTPPLSVSVVFPDHFIIGVNPGAIQVHEGTNGTAQILLESYGFNGTVHLNVRTFAVRNLGILVPISLAYKINSPDVTLQADPDPFTARFFYTNITVTTPLTSLPFKYQLNINATYGSMFSYRALIVLPPPVSLSVTVHPTTIFVRAGTLSSTTITVQSVDYFWGFLSASAIMSGAAVTFNSSIYYIALPNSANVSYTPWQSIGMTVNVTTSTPPGNYVALLTVYSLATLYQRAFSTQVEVPVVIESALGAPAGRVFGLSSTFYFVILGALAIPLIVLSVLTYVRREREDDHDWRA